MPQDFEATPATASVRVTRPASPVPCFAPSQSPNSTAAKPSSALQILPEARAIEAADEVIRCVDGECSNPLPAGRKFRDGVATTVEPPTPTPAVAPAPAAPTSIIGSWRGNVTLTMAQKGQTPSTQSDEVTFEIERALFIATNDTMNTSTNSPKPIECSGHSWRPVAYVAMLERSARQRIVSVLEHAGWAVIPQPSGFTSSRPSPASSTVTKRGYDQA